MQHKNSVGKYKILFYNITYYLNVDICIKSAVNEKAKIQIQKFSEETCLANCQIHL